MAYTPGEGLGRIEATLVDATTACVFLRASDIGLRGDETPAELEAEDSLLTRLEAIRRAAAGARPRRSSPASKASGLSRIQRMSNIGIPPPVAGRTYRRSARCRPADLLGVPRHERNSGDGIFFFINPCVDGGFGYIEHNRNKTRLQGDQGPCAPSPPQCTGRHDRCRVVPVGRRRTGLRAPAPGRHAGVSPSPVSPPCW